MRKSFWRGLLRGFGSAAEIFGERVEPEFSASTTDALRSDWERIGRDFRAVISREAPRKSEGPASAAHCPAA